LGNGSIVAQHSKPFCQICLRGLGIELSGNKETLPDLPGWVRKKSLKRIVNQLAKMTLF